MNFARFSVPMMLLLEIDRNVNTTNVLNQTKFYNFFRPPKHPEVYITSIEQYKKKIDETIKFGGDQILIQGDITQI